MTHRISGSRSRPTSTSARTSVRLSAGPPSGRDYHQDSSPSSVRVVLRSHRPTPPADLAFSSILMAKSKILARQKEINFFVIPIISSPLDCIGHRTTKKSSRQLLRLRRACLCLSACCFLLFWFAWFVVFIGDCKFQIGIV